MNAWTTMSVISPPVGNDQSGAVTPQARTALWASLVGTTIEWYDFFLYATAASLVFNKAFFPDQTTFVGPLLSFATFAVGFVVRPIGGFVFGHVGDRIGRKRTLALTMLLMGINRFLEHTLFVTANNLRGIQLDKLLKAVVSVNDAAIEV